MSQPTSREEQRDRLLEAALVHVPFDGWSRRSLFAGAADLGLEPSVARRLFPRAGDDLLVQVERWADRQMLARVGPLDDLRVRERIARLVRTRLEVLGPHREAMRRATAARLLPSNGLQQAFAARRGLDQHVLVLAGGPVGRVCRDLVLPRTAHRQRHADRQAARPRRRLHQGSRPPQPDGATTLTVAYPPPDSGGGGGSTGE
jgi:hypothetical protein